MTEPTTIVLACVGGGVTLTVPIVTVLAARWSAKKDADILAKKVETVRTDLVNSNTHVTEKLEEIHTLVNSRLTAALEYIKRLEVLLRAATGRPMEGEQEAYRKE